MKLVLPFCELKTLKEMPVRLSHYYFILLLQVNPEELKEGKDKFHFQRQIWVPLKEVLFI